MNRNLREYKASVFAMIFNDPKEALQLYNALNGTNYSNVEDVKIDTLVNEDGLADGMLITMKNDVSFVLQEYHNFYEHQSTDNNNMPLRFLLYFTEEIRRDIPHRRLLVDTGISLSTPVFILFYNGKRHQEDRFEMKLSDLYKIKTKKPALELAIRVYNINKGQNRKLLKACKRLAEYAEFVDQTRNALDGIKDEKEQRAILLNVIEECIKEGILSDFLEKYKERVVDNYLLFDKEDYKLAYDEYIEELEQKAKEEAERADMETKRADMESIRADSIRINDVSNLIKNTGMTMDAAMDALGVAEKDRRCITEALTD